LKIKAKLSLSFVKHRVVKKWGGGVKV
jgi:hypothetical protein